jgi:hypothetical protein
MHVYQIIKENLILLSVLIRKRFSAEGFTKHYTIFFETLKGGKRECPY